MGSQRLSIPGQWVLGVEEPWPLSPSLLPLLKSREQVASLGTGATFWKLLGWSTGQGTRVGSHLVATRAPSPPHHVTLGSRSSKPPVRSEQPTFARRQPRDKPKKRFPSRLTHPGPNIVGNFHDCSGPTRRAAGDRRSRKQDTGRRRGSPERHARARALGTARAGARSGDGTGTQSRPLAPGAGSAAQSPRFWTGGQGTPKTQSGACSCGVSPQPPGTRCRGVSWALSHCQEALWEALLTWERCLEVGDLQGTLGVWSLRGTRRTTWAPPRPVEPGA